MTPVPLDLPLRPSDAADLANLIFDQAERKPLTDELRNRLAARASVLRLETIRPYMGSLERDPVHPDTYYLAVDAAQGEPLLLHMALATAPTSSIFHKPLLIGRMRRHRGPEMVINALPFGPADRENLDLFAGRTQTGFLPRPQGSRAAIVVPAVPETLSRAFETYRTILKRTGKNLAAIGPGYHAGLSGAIRSGWREEYSAAAEIIPVTESAETVRERVKQCPACTRYALELSPLLRESTAVEEQFDRSFGADDRGWIFETFARRFDVGDAAYELAEQDVLRLAVRFGPALDAARQASEWIRQTRSALKSSRPFELELGLEGAPASTSAAELLFCLHWLRSRGAPAHFAAPRLPASLDTVKDLAAVCRHYQCTLSIAERPDHSAEDRIAIGRATRGRFLYRLAGECPLEDAAQQMLT